ncbi:MAG: response regulator, partial [Spirochaetia bacterium]|nr:response regulator [Spirochaetia bacterium]
MKNIAVIEDTLTVQEEIKMILEFEGYRVHAASTGNQGLQIIQKINPDLILCDIMMPDMDGYELLKYLRNSPGTSEIPFIFLTAKASRKDVRNGMNLGADDYITKPFTVEELLQAINSRLERKDIITRKLKEEIAITKEELSYAVNFDAPTGLPKESILENWIDGNLNPDKAESQFCLYLIQMDRLNNLIHSLGVHAGEHILHTIAERLVHAAGEKAIVFKPELCDYGIIVNLDQNKNETFYADSFIEIIKKEIHFQGLDLFIPGNIGFCLHNKESNSFPLMKNHAYKAIRHARLGGLNQHAMYESSLDTLSSLQENLEESIFRAIEKNELSMAYQPQVSLSSNKIMGAEALIRWNHTDYGNISPAQFIPIAEETGMIVKLGEWIFKQVVS